MDLRKWERYALSGVRIMVGLLFGEHGSQKMFDWPAGGHGVLPINTFNGFGGLLEFVGGILILLGLFTRPAAFILAGEMAVAYFKVHAPMNFFPVNNKGEDAILFCFVFLLFIFTGAGPVSLDALIAKKRNPASADS